MARTSSTERVKARSVGNLFDDVGRLAVAAQGRFKGGERQLAAAQGALQMILVHLADQFFFADHQARLRAAEDFVAAEGHDIGAGSDSFADQRLFRQAVQAQVDQRAAAEIFHHRQIMLFADGDHLFQASLRR